MARILILAFDTFGGTPERELFAWKLGHVIDIKPDGHVWGSSEQLPKFYQIDVTGATVDDVKDFIASKMNMDDPSGPKATSIRKWILDFNGLPAAIRNQLNTVGRITVSKVSTFQGYMTLVP